MQAYCELLTKCRNTDRCDVRTLDQIGGTCNVMGDPPDRPNFGITWTVTIRTGASSSTSTASSGRSRAR